MSETSGEDAAQDSFASQLARLTPTPWALVLLMALNVGVWLAGLAAGFDAMKPGTAELLRWGANSASSVTLDHEYWRLLTATFLHGGLLHLALNMYGLWGAGLVLNRMLGNAQFLLLYLGSALAGSALSLHFSSQKAVSVGASGAVFGVLGALLVSLIQHRERIDPAARRGLIASQGIFVAYALVQGFVSQGIDNAAHVGGLLAGAVLAWLLVERLDSAASSARRAAMVMASIALVALAVTALVLTTPAPTVHHREQFAFQSGLRELLPRIQAAENALTGDARALQERRLDQAGFVQALSQRHLPAYRAVATELARLSLPADDSLAPVLADMRRQNELVRQMMEIEVRRGGGAPQADDEARLKAITTELREIGARMKAPRKP